MQRFVLHICYTQLYIYIMHFLFTVFFFYFIVSFLHTVNIIHSAPSFNIFNKIQLKLMLYTLYISALHYTLPHIKINALVLEAVLSQAKYIFKCYFELSLKFKLHITNPQYIYILKFKL